MSNLADFIGGSSNIEINIPSHQLAKVSNDVTPQNEQNIFSTSTTYTAQSAGKYFVLLSGGGGSGGVANLDNITMWCSSGGGSGDVKYGVFTLTNGENVQITIGAGGAGVTCGSVSVNGNNGGVTSFGGYLSTDSIANAGKASNDANVLVDIAESGFRTVSYSRKGSIYNEYTLSDVNIKLNVLYDVKDGGSYVLGGSAYSLGGASSILSSGVEGKKTAVTNAILGAGSAGAGYDNRSGEHSRNGGDGFAIVVKIG